MKVAVLTSSRADYGIYFPLLKAMLTESSIETSIIAFGTHTSEKYGRTVNTIINDGFPVEFIIDGIPKDDSSLAISEFIGETIVKFAAFWETKKFDLVFCLGDRYEMFAACVSSIPFNVKLAHIHGGEHTAGSIDDIFRHSITHMASYHFTTTEIYKQRVSELKGTENRVFNVGALSIDHLKMRKLLTKEEFYFKFGIDLTLPTILITFHPETVSLENNEFHIKELIAALTNLTDYQLLITMPNADTMGNLIRSNLQEFAINKSNVKLKETLGSEGYLSCMKHCAMMLGNTSSGFVEAYYFGKYVINLGERQNGRIITPNIFNCKIDRFEISNAVRKPQKFDDFQKPHNLYGEGNTAIKILNIIRTINDK